MNKKMRWIFLFALLLGLSTMACGLLTGDEPEETTAGETETEAQEAVEEEPVSPTETEEEAEPTEEPTPVPEPTATAEPEPTDEPTEAMDEEPGDGLPDLSNIGSAVGEFNSYRATVNMTFESIEEGGTSAGLFLETAVILEPPATSATISVTGDMVEQAGGFGSMTFAEVGDASYAVIPGMGCVAGGAGELGSMDEFTEIFATDEILGEISDAEFVGEETVNGIAVDHYTFDETDVEDTSGDLQELEGHVYVAQDGGYVTRMVIEGVGTVDMFDQGVEEEGTLILEYNITDVGADFEIELPEGCEDAGAQYPTFEGAADLTSFAGFTSYTVEADLDDVVAFYEEEMAALGYEQPDSDQIFSEGSAILSFSGEELDPVTVIINQEEEGTVSVTLTSEATGE